MRTSVAPQARSHAGSHLRERRDCGAATTSGHSRHLEHVEPEVRQRACREHGERHWNDSFTRGDNTESRCVRPSPSEQLQVCRQRGSKSAGRCRQSVVTERGVRVGFSPTCPGLPVCSPTPMSRPDEPPSMIAMFSSRKNHVGGTSRSTNCCRRTTELVDCCLNVSVVPRVVPPFAGLSETTAISGCAQHCCASSVRGQLRSPGPAASQPHPPAFPCRCTGQLPAT